MPATARRAKSTATSRQRRPAAGSRGKPASPAGGYWQASGLPLTSLLFVLPLLALHEIGVHRYGTLPGRVVEYRIAAFTLLNRFFHYFGASGRYLPALAVVAVLLSWHIARNDRWVFNIPLLPLMLVESVAWAVPLVGVYFWVSPSAPTYLPVGDWKLMASLYLGAGVYEELIFRLGAISVLSFLLMDVGRLRGSVATPLIVLISAATFSGYHILGTGPMPWQAFVFIGLRGVYYAIIFLERGFGVSVGVHTAYDLFFLGLREVNGH
jgi:hypothetical protein